jgi:hypothetical protein
MSNEFSFLKKTIHSLSTILWRLEQWANACTAAGRHE